MSAITKDSNIGSSSNWRVENPIIYGLITILLCLTLPWELFPYPLSQLSIISAGAGEFFETRLFFYISTLVLVCIWLLSGYIRGSFCFKRTSLDIPVILFLLVVIISIFQLNDLHASIDAFFLILSYILCFYLVLNSVRSLSDLKIIGYTLVISGSVIGLYGIYQYLVGFEQLSKYVAENALGTVVPNRVFTIFISPNHLAGFLIMIIPLAFVLLIIAQKSWERTGLIASLIIMTECVVLTFSRGGWISLGLAMLVLIVGCLITKKLKSLVYLAVVAILVVAISASIIKVSFSGSSQKPSISALKSSEATMSAQGRFLLWQGTLRMIEAHPIGGIGIGAFATMHPLFQYGGLYSKHAHNTYLELFAETGILGFVLMIAIFFLILRKGIEIVRLKKDTYSQLALGLVAGSMAFMAHSFIDFEWSMASTGFIFWTIAGCIFACERLVGNSNDPSKDYDIDLDKGRNRTWFLIVMVIVLIPIFFLSSAVAGLYLYNQGKIYYRERNMERSIKLLEEAIGFDPLDHTYQSRLSQLYFEKAVSADSSEMKSALLPQAFNRAKNAISLRPSWAEYYARLGSIYSYQKENDKAITAFEKSQELYPKNPKYKVMTGEFYYSLKDYKRAEIEFEKALALRKYYRVWYPEYTKKDFERAYFDIGLLYKEQGKYTQAKKNLREVIKLNPQNKIAKEELKSIESRRR